MILDAKKYPKINPAIYHIVYINDMRITPNAKIRNHVGSSWFTGFHTCGMAQNRKIA